jgi:hypothetical protein
MDYKKGYLKIHEAVDVKTNKILSMEVTDEHVHDSKTLPESVVNIIKSDRKTTGGKLFADYDDIFGYLTVNRIYISIY